MRDSIVSAGANLDSISRTFTSTSFTLGDILGKLAEQSSLLTDTRLCLELTSHAGKDAVLVVVVRLKITEEMISV